MKETKKESTKKEKPTAIVKKTEGIITITKETVKRYLCDTASEQEIALFINQCKMWNLNPFKREIYLVKYVGQPAFVTIGYETFLKRADRLKKLKGWKAWTEGKDVILKKDDPEFKACLQIFREDWTEPFYHEVYWQEYCQTKRDGTLTRFWREKPRTMLKKVVISQGFKMCFPDELGSMPYISEEMPIDTSELPTDEVKEKDEVIDAEVVEEKEEEVEEEPVEEEKEFPPDHPPLEPGKPKERSPALEMETFISVIQEDLKIRYSKTYKDDYPLFKYFLSLFQDKKKKEGKEYHFVEKNEFQKWSLHCGKLKDIKALAENIGYMAKQYADWKEENPHDETEPF